MQAQTLELRFLVYPEGGQYIAQCLDHDIATQAETFGGLKESIQRVLIGHIELAARSHVEPLDFLASIPRAPQEYWDKYEASTERQRLPGSGACAQLALA